MDTLSLVALAVAAVVAVIGLVRAAGATKELAVAQAELAEIKAELQAAREELRALAAPKAKPAEAKVAEAPPKPKPAPKPEPKPAPQPEPKPEPEPPPEPKLDPEVVKRAEVILSGARLMARHVGFEAQIEVKGRKGVRVPVEVNDDIDEQALAHLEGTSDVVLDSGTRNGDRFLVVRV